MAVCVRFSRIGRKNHACFKIVAADSRFKRDGRFLQDLGTYDPIEKKVESIDMDGLNYWQGVGAVFSDSVTRVVKNYKKGLLKASASK